MEIDHNITYRFVQEISLQYGKSLYLLGSHPQLKSWKVYQAIQMKCYENKYWTVCVQIPINVQIEYKYIIGPSSNNLSHENITWVGQQNSKLLIPINIARKFSKEDSCQLNIMSFNVRFENQKDKGPYSWQNRKQNCSNLIKQILPDIIGVQQPKKNQRQYLFQAVKSIYNYYGKPRNLVDDEQSGIFIRKDKFVVIEDGYIWINQEKRDGKKGFGARLPRYYTFLVVKNINLQAPPFIVFNTHLDHETENSRLQGIKYITQTISKMIKKYQNLSSIFVTGDFNTSDDNFIFKSLKYQQQQLQSVRQILPQNKTNHQATFNGFSKVLKIVDKTLKFFNLDPGATIDHIFYRSKFYKPVQFKVIHNEGDVIVSDHYPILAKFEASIN